MLDGCAKKKLANVLIRRIVKIIPLKSGIFFLGLIKSWRKSHETFQIYDNRREIAICTKMKRFGNTYNEGITESDRTY